MTICEELECSLDLRRSGKKKENERENGGENPKEREYKDLIEKKKRKSERNRSKDVN